MHTWKKATPVWCSEVIRLSNAASRDSKESVLGRVTGTMPCLLLSVVKITLPQLKGGDQRMDSGGDMTI